MTVFRRAGRRSAAGAGAVFSVVALGVPLGCSQQPSPAASVTASAPIVLPASPGESAATILPGQTVPPSLLSTPRRAGDEDIRFAQTMVPHHAQAIEMAALAPGRARRPQVAALADRIGASQRPEIAVMQAWLAAQGRTSQTGHGGGHDQGHDGAAGAMGAMGMASETDLRRLADARGEAFDQLFVRLMTRHHEGAVAMAERQARDGSDTQLLELAGSVIAEQGAEIGRLRDSLR
jgi:uncharacterized protein (DUF305 family)